MQNFANKGVKMNKEEENEICMKCGNCCKNYWIYTNVPEEVERFETLSNMYIEVVKITEKLWKIIFKLGCNHLNYREDGTVRCLIYDEKRPKYCPDYPRNFLEKDVEKEILEYEKKFCPLLAKLIA